MARKKAFSLAEVLIAMLLIGILSAVVMKVMKDRDNTLEHQAKRDKAIINMQSVLKERMFNAKIDEADNALVVAALQELSSSSGKLRDGVTYSVTGGSGNYVAIVEIDANGKDIPPNKERMDVFKYYVDKYGNFVNQDLVNGNKLEAGGTSRWGIQLPISGNAGTGNNNNQGGNDEDEDKGNSGGTPPKGVTLPTGGNGGTGGNDEGGDQGGNDQGGGNEGGGNDAGGDQGGDENVDEGGDDNNQGGDDSDQGSGDQGGGNEGGGNDEGGDDEGDDEGGGDDDNDDDDDEGGGSGGDETITCKDGSVINVGETCMQTCKNGSVIAESETCMQTCKNGSVIAESETCMQTCKNGETIAESETCMQTCADGSSIAESQTCQKTCWTGNRIDEDEDCPVAEIGIIFDCHSSTACYVSAFEQGDNAMGYGNGALVGYTSRGNNIKITVTSSDGRTFVDHGYSGTQGFQAVGYPEFGAYGTTCPSDPWLVGHCFQFHCHHPVMKVKITTQDGTEIPFSVSQTYVVEPGSPTPSKYDIQVESSSW